MRRWCPLSPSSPSGSGAQDRASEVPSSPSPLPWLRVGGARGSQRWSALSSSSSSWVHVAWGGVSGVPRYCCCHRGRRCVQLAAAAAECPLVEGACRMLGLYWQSAPPLSSLLVTHTAQSCVGGVGAFPPCHRCGH